MRLWLSELALLWRLFTWRHWRRSPWKALLLTSILALGVAVFFSIRLANRAAVGGFELFSENVTGTSDFVLTSPAGELPATLLTDMRAALGEIPAGLFPVLESTAIKPAPGMKVFAATSFQIIGVDLAALPNIVYLSKRETQPNLGDRGEAWPDIPALFVSSTLASKQDWKVNDKVSLIVDDKVRECVVAGILPTGDFEVQQPDNLIVMDLPQLQEITSQTDRLHRVEVRVPEGHWAIDAAPW